MSIHNRTFTTEFGKFEANFEVSNEQTQESCDVCDGKRPAQITVIFRAMILGVIDSNYETWTWNEFEDAYASIANAIRSQLESRGFGKPVCIECQQDLLLVGRDRYTPNKSPSKDTDI